MITSLLLPFSWCFLLLALLSMTIFSNIITLSPAYAAPAVEEDSEDAGYGSGEEDEGKSNGVGQKFNSMTNSLPPPNPYVVEGLGESDLSALTALAQKKPTDTDQTDEGDLRRRRSGAQGPDAKKTDDKNEQKPGDKKKETEKKKAPVSSDSKEGSKTSSTARERWLKAGKAVRAPGSSSAPPPASPAEKAPANDNKAPPQDKRKPPFNTETSRKRKAESAVDQNNNPRQKRQRVTDGRVTKISTGPKNVKNSSKKPSPKNVISTPKERPPAKKPRALSVKRNLSGKASNVRGPCATLNEETTTTPLKATSTTNITATTKN